MMGHVGKLVCVAAALGTAVAWAQQASPPSDPGMPASGHAGRAVTRTAIITAPKVYARCGPSTNYYPTAVLKRGQRVEVVQVRPDGWAAIVPPEGSFCWVSGDFVRIVEPGIGEATEDGVWVWIGSTVSPRLDHSQVRLKKGQRVRILKSSVFAEDALQRVWLQIEPPEGEVRWVKAEYLRFEDDEPGSAHAAHVPPPPAREGAAGALEAESVEEMTAPPPDAQSGAQETDEAFARRLFEQAEAAYRDLMQQPVGQRDILPLKAKYEQVLRLTQNPVLRKVVHTRLGLLEREEIRERYARKFLQLLERSRARDRELLGLARRSAQPSAATMPAATAGQRSPSAGAGPALPPAHATAASDDFDRWFDDPFAFEGDRDVSDDDPFAPGFASSRPAATTAARPAPQHGVDRSPSRMPPPMGQPPVPGQGLWYGGQHAMAGQPLAAAPGLPPGYGTVVGVLHPAGRTPQGRRRYVVRDPRSGRALGYVVEAPGLRLDPYVGKLTRITGRILSPTAGAAAEVMARRVEPVVR